ncbi:antitoxin Xre/MbcA/ParS toxin-binding domain-containing protein [Vibrio splendidus]
MLRLLYPEHPLRYEWVMRGNTRINGDRPIDVMLTGSEGIMRVNKVLRGQLIR